MGPRPDILCTVIVITILVFGSLFEENILPAVESQLSSTLKIIKLTAGIEDTFDFIVTGPTSYNPSISTVGTPGGEITPNSNQGTYGSSADGKYFENDIQTNFNTVLGILNSAVLQEGTEQLQDQGEIRFGTNSQWDFLHTPTGSNIMSINLWFRGDIVDDGEGDDFPILSTLNPDAGDTNGILLYLRNNNLRLSIIENGVTIEDSNLGVNFSLTNDGQWHMITLAIDHGNTISQEIIPCLDAVCSQEFRDQPFAGGGGTADKTLTIGSQSVVAGSTPVEPSFEVDDFTIWHGYFLTSSDITALYNGGSGVSAGVTGLGISLANQVGHWTFDLQTSSGIGVDGPNPVAPGIYFIQEIIPAGWDLTAANCNDGSSSFSVDTVQGIAIDPGDNIECTFVNLPSLTDTDSDGISNEVDTLPGTSSNDFSDSSIGGTSSGTITTRGDQVLIITEETNPAGVRITTSISGGLLPAVINTCGGISIITLNSGNEIVVTCGSATIDVINGPVDVAFIGSGGTQATTTLSAGNSITFDQDTFSFSAPSTNVDPVVVIVEGEQITINPGEATSILSSNKDSFIKQGELNTNEGVNTMMRVRDSGNNRALVLFDQNEILAAAQGRTLLSATLRLYIEENGNNWGPNGRTIDVHRLLADWTEGNGFNDKPESMPLSQFNAIKTRGDGLGVTWKCATDTEINNQQTNCSPQWNGATFNLTPTNTITIFKDNPPTGTVKTVGWIEFDVTSDLQTFLSNTEPNYGWIVKKTEEGAPGIVEFTSDESPANTPELVLVFD